MIRSLFPLPALAAAFCLGLPAAGFAQEGVLQRGELLYTTYCSDCHSKEMHWREKKLATDWDSLLAQVRRWQGNAGRSWDKGDTVAIACYLNTRYYRLPSVGGDCGR